MSWLSFAGQLLSTGASLTDKLVTSGQQNRTNRELSLAQISSQTEKYKANQQFISIVIIGGILIVGLLLILKRI